VQGGDLSNRLPPRWLVVFEGVIGVHPEPRLRQQYDFWAKTRRWNRAVRTFQPEADVIKRLWDMTWRQDYKFDVATFLPCGSGPVRTWLDVNNVPAVNVLPYEAPVDLGKRLAYMPDVYAVVHASEEDRFMYGHRGVLVSDGWT
jgi:hypothetical protein